jgi:hypothetical protein
VTDDLRDVVLDEILDEDGDPIEGLDIDDEPSERARALPIAASGGEFAKDREPGEHRSYDTAKWRTETRKKVLKRDGYRCKLKLEGCTGKATQVDHIRNGGPSTPSNLRASCASCNGKRAAKSQHRK